MAKSLEWEDYLALVGYFAIVIGFGIWVCQKKTPSKKKTPL
jgi:hypothetical protein